MISEMTTIEAAEILEKRMSRYHPSDVITAATKLAIDILRQIDAGEIVPVVHGYWKEVELGHDILFECSNCGRIISTSWGCCEDEDTKGNNGCDPIDEWLCCPTCGALMDGRSGSDG